MDSAPTAKLLPTLLFSLVKHREQSSYYLLCGCLSEGYRPANHKEPGTEQNHPRSAPGWECFLFAVITDRTGWAIAQLPADWTNLILWRKPGRPKGLKPGKLPAKLLRPLRLGYNRQAWRIE